jgi:hypothetical protein
MRVTRSTDLLDACRLGANVLSELASAVSVYTVLLTPGVAAARLISARHCGQ